MDQKEQQQLMEKDHPPEKTQKKPSTKFHKPDQNRPPRNLHNLNMRYLTGPMTDSVGWFPFTILAPDRSGRKNFITIINNVIQNNPFLGIYRIVPTPGAIYLLMKNSEKVFEFLNSLSGGAYAIKAVIGATEATRATEEDEEVLNRDGSFQEQITYRGFIKKCLITPPTVGVDARIAAKLIEKDDVKYIEYMDASIIDFTVGQEGANKKLSFTSQWGYLIGIISLHDIVALTQANEAITTNYIDILRDPTSEIVRIHVVEPNIINKELFDSYEEIIRRDVLRFVEGKFATGTTIVEETATIAEPTVLQEEASKKESSRYVLIRQAAPEQEETIPNEPNKVPEEPKQTQELTELIPSQAGAPPQGEVAQPKKVTYKITGYELEFKHHGVPKAKVHILINSTKENAILVDLSDSATRTNKGVSKNTGQSNLTDFITEDGLAELRAAVEERIDSFSNKEPFMGDLVRTVDIEINLSNVETMRANTEATGANTILRHYKAYDIDTDKLISISSKIPTEKVKYRG
jgi:hypothetical protein